MPTRTPVIIHRPPAEPPSADALRIAYLQRRGLPLERAVVVAGLAFPVQPTWGSATR